jgi:hypothetical protein
LYGARAAAPRRPEHAEHVLAANQDNYVKAFIYRPLRALTGNGLTSEGGVGSWRRGRGDALWVVHAAVWQLVGSKP